MNNMQGYEAWRITYQSSEQAARAAYAAGLEICRENEAEKIAQHKLVRALDVALNGEAGVAPQANLCDLVSQVRFISDGLGGPVLRHVTTPVGEVESALPGAGGFHVRLANNVAMPAVGTKLYVRIA